MTYTFATDPLYVSEGDYIQFKFDAPPFWNFQRTITVQIGDLTQYWILTTVTLDLTPDPFPLQGIDPAELDTLYVYGDRAGEEIVEVSGLTTDVEAGIGISSNYTGGIDAYAIRIDYNGDGTWDTGTAANDYWIQTDGSQGVKNGARVQLRARSSTFNNTTVRVTLVIGTSSETWNIKTKPVPANEPVPFPDFTDLFLQPVNTYCYSEVLRIQGLTEAAPISMTNGGEYGISTTGNTTVNSNGFSVLSGVTFRGTQGTIQNGDYLQLRILSASTGSTPKTTDLNIGDVAAGDTWSVTTDANPSTTPDAFSFTDVPAAIEDFLTPSDQQPVGGITGLGTEVDAVLVSTTSSEVKIQVNDATPGVFPARVNNGDKLRLYARSSADFGGVVNATIRVGSRQIATWTVVTNTGPDTSASFTPPPNRNGQVPDTFVSSAPVTVTGINRPITIQVLSGYNALISIDYDTPVVGPRTFDPTINTSFYLIVKTSSNLDTPEQTEVQVGTGSSNNPFFWVVRTYTAVPPAADQLGTWYSKKSAKFDGYPLGTVLPILKEGVGSYGTVDPATGELTTRYPGFLVCEGQSLDAQQYSGLFDAIGNNYGGNGIRTESDTGLVTYTGNFNLPDYRNRRLCGVGPVDSTNGNSAALNVLSLDGKGITDAGGQGGFWYFDKVDSFGVLPLEQIQAASGNQTGLNSQFFTLGTVRVTGLEEIITDVTFSISGYMVATVGPLSDILVAAPDHTHTYITGRVQSEGGAPLIPWETVALQGYEGTIGPFVIESIDAPESGSSAETIRAAWVQWFTEKAPNFVRELNRYYSDFDLDSWIRSVPVPTDFEVNMKAPPTGVIGSTQLGPVDEDREYDVEFPLLLWWTSPDSELDAAVSGGLLQNTGASFTGNNVSAVIDTKPDNFRIDSYTSESGQTNPHSHLITENITADPQTDYTGGNEAGAGTNADPYGSGLGAGVAGGLINFQLWERRTVDSLLPDGGRWTNRGLGDWAYRLTNGDGYWTSPDDSVTLDCPMYYSGDHLDAGKPTPGSGMILNITFTPWPATGGDPIGDTRYRVNSVVNRGQDYAVGDELTTAWWDDFPGSGNRMFRVTSVQAGASGGAATQVPITFSQDDIFMDMTQAEFKFNKSFKQPVPDVTMRPQRQVPIINAFHKTKYIIKAY